MRYRLVTLEYVKQNSRITFSADDDFLEELVADASESIMDYIDVAYSLALVDADWTDSYGVPLTDSNGDPLDAEAVPGPIRRATVVTVALWYEDAEGLRDALPPAAVSLLARTRDVPIA